MPDSQRTTPEFFFVSRRETCRTCCYFRAAPHIRGLRTFCVFTGEHRRSSARACEMWPGLPATARSAS